MSAETLRVLIEQAVARGEPPERISAALHTTPTQVRAVLAAMDRASREADVTADDNRRTTARTRKPRHGSHAAYTRHQQAREEPCWPCVLGERRWRNRHPRRAA